MTFLIKLKFPYPMRQGKQEQAKETEEVGERKEV